MDPAEIRFIPKAFIKERGAEVLEKSANHSSCECYLRILRRRRQTKKLPIPSARWIFIPPLAICFLIANTCTKWRCNFEGLPQHGGWADFAKNFRPSLFNNDLSNEPNFGGSISLDSTVGAQFTFILYVIRILLWRQWGMKSVYHKWRNPLSLWGLRKWHPSPTIPRNTCSSLMREG